MILRQDGKDILAGGVLILFGLAAAGYGLATLSFGSLRQMGPGMFPAALGVFIAALGFAILVPAFRQAGTLPAAEWRPLLAISSAILVFAFAIEPLGLVPTVVLVVVIASRADGKLSIAKAILLGLAASALAVLIFNVGLRLRLPIATWPF